jgi:GxxExxY protein
MWKPVNRIAEEREIINKLAYEVRGAIFEVFRTFGPGLLESIYEAAMIEELTLRGLKVVSQMAVDIQYKGKPLNVSLRIDLLVADKIIVELKSVEELHPIHYKQLTTYLKLTDKRLGILVNFNREFMRDKQDIIRIANKF